MKKINDHKISRVEAMRKKTEEPNVGYHKFMTKYPQNKNRPICLVEGEDEKYFIHRVKVICDNIDPLFIRCGNRDSVIKNYRNISSKKEYQEGKVFYFIDKDYEQAQKESDIYTTPWYSIENLYTSEKSIEAILRNQFKLDDTEEDFTIALNCYRDRHKEFQEGLIFFNAWLYLQTKERESKLMLRDFKIDKFIAVKLDTIEVNYDYKKIEKTFPGAKKLAQEDVERKAQEFKNFDLQCISRGKFEVQFLEKFIKLLKNEIGKKDENRKIFIKKKKVNLEIYDVISQFSSYAETPQCLHRYLVDRWTKFKIVSLF